MSDTPTGSSRLERAARALLDVLRPEYDGGDDDLDNSMDDLRAALAEAEAGRAERGVLADPAQSAAMHLERRADEIQAGKEPVSAVNELREAARLIQTWSPNFDEIVSSGKMLRVRAAPEPATAAEREVVDAAVDFATMSAPDAEEWGSIRVVRLGRLVNAVHALRGILASRPA